MDVIHTLVHTPRRAVALEPAPGSSAVGHRRPTLDAERPTRRSQESLVRTVFGSVAASIVPLPPAPARVSMVPRRGTVSVDDTEDSP
jgi:hypothetical protein